MSQIINETFFIQPPVTGGTFSYSSQTLTLVNGDSSVIVVNG